MKKIIPVLNTLFIWKVDFEKKSGTSHWEISTSCTIQEHNIIIQFSFNYLWLNNDLENFDILEN